MSPAVQNCFDRCPVQELEVLQKDMPSEEAPALMRRRSVWPDTRILFRHIQRHMAEAQAIRGLNLLTSPASPAQAIEQPEADAKPEEKEEVV